MGSYLEMSVVFQKSKRKWPKPGPVFWSLSLILGISGTDSAFTTPPFCRAPPTAGLVVPLGGFVN